MQRLPGPQCASGLGPDWIDGGTLSLGKASAPQPLGGDELSPEEHERLLDLSQMVLDLAGFVDPTPISDGTNAAISITRGDWFGAGLSGVALIPYVGDLAKVGKLGRWAQAVHKSIALAKRNARFAERVRPVLRQIANVLEQVPTNLLPDAAKSAVVRIKADLDSVLGLTAKLPRAVLLERYLQRWYRYIDDLQLSAPTPGSGALWSKLGSVEPGTQGADIAERLAAQHNKVTLEMTLRPSGFQKKYELAVEQLKERLGDQAGNLWDDFGRKIWTRVSTKYVGLLQGRVTAYTKYQGQGGVISALQKGDEPILIDELEEIATLIGQNPGITSVEVIDVVRGPQGVMMRDAVLAASRSSH